MIANPFDINKAVDYSDEEIYKFWVDINTDLGFNEVLKPNSHMPIILAGSKGSGKTHIMKYYSYELQKIRLNAESKQKGLKEGFEKENFVGVYVRCSGLNAKVFSGKGLSNDLWESLFAYYWELWMGERMLSVLEDMLKEGILTDVDEDVLVKDILGLFLNYDATCNDLMNLRKYFLEQQKALLYEIHNFLLLSKDKPEVEVRLHISGLTYGIPNLLQKNVPFFKKRKILYLIDEYENFSEEQQQVMMTLLRECPTSCSVRLGARPYGIRTYYTMGRIEENREGSEYEYELLDDKIREASNSKDYLKDICEKRLQGAGITLGNSFNLSDHIMVMTTEELLLKAVGVKSTHKKRDKLAKDLEEYKEHNLTKEEIEKIVNWLTCETDLIVERASFDILYQKMKSKSKDLVKDAEDIANAADLYNKKEHSKDNAIVKRLNYYKRDIIDSIARDANIPIPYYGLDTLIELSCGTPRTLLRLLKYAFSKQYFNTGKVPFEKSRDLKIESQQFGIESTGEWFFEEHRISNDVLDVIGAVRRLGTYLQNLRFTDLPPQCSINIFSVQKENLSDEAMNTLNQMELYSYIVPHKDRRKKNMDSKSSTYKFNTILVPKFELSLETRGNVEISKEDAEILFNPARKDDFEDFLSNKRKAYNYPFSRQKRKKKLKTLPESQQRSLFDDYGL